MAGLHNSRALEMLNHRHNIACSQRRDATDESYMALMEQRK
jgi:hypothetical protein